MPSPPALSIEAPDAEDLVADYRASVALELPLAPSPRTLRRKELWKLFFLFLVLTAALRLPAFFVEVFNSDETFLATQAQVLRDGGNLYEEAADRKPPLVPYLYAAAFEVFGTNALWSVRMVAMLASALTALMLAAEARRRYGRRAGWAAGVLCVFSLVAFAPQDGQAANFEIFMLPAMTASILLARRGRSTSAGVAVAVATLAKQTGAFTILPVFYLLWRRRGRRGMGDAALGFAAPLALVALALGPRHLLYWTVLGNGSYVGLDTVSFYVAAMFVLMTLGWAASNLPMIWRLPLAWKHRRRPTLDGEHDLDLWLWIASAAVAVAVGLRFFGHYYLQLIPPLCLLAAGALARGSRRIAVGSLVVAGLVAVGFSAWGYLMRPFSPEPEYRAVSNYVMTHSSTALCGARSDRVFVWGSLPEVYWASDTLPATRFVTTNTFLAGNHPGRPGADAAPEDITPIVWDWLFEDFAAHPPQYVLDTAPAKIRGAEYTPIDRFPRLQAMIDTDYSYVRTIDGIDIYERLGC